MNILAEIGFSKIPKEWVFLKNESTYKMKDIESVVFKSENGEEIVLLTDSKPVNIIKMPQETTQED